MGLIINESPANPGDPRSVTHTTTVRDSEKSRVVVNNDTQKVSVDAKVLLFGERGPQGPPGPVALATGTDPATSPLLGIEHLYVDTAAGGSSGGSGAIVGTGSPEGVIEATVGTEYTDTAGTNGAWRWLKTSGTGNTGWTVALGDTGFRNIRGLINDTAFLASWSSLEIRRTGNIVYLTADLYSRAAGPQIPSLFVVGHPNGIPVGFRPAGYSATTSVYTSTFYDNTVRPDRLSAELMGRTGYLVLKSSDRKQGWADEENYMFQFLFVTDDPWPTTLPGAAT